MIKNLIVGALILATYFFWTNRDIAHGPGEIAPNRPNISHLTWQKPFTYSNYILTPKRSISGEVRVLEKKKYFFDEINDLVPYDFFVGWSKMSDERNLDHMYITLSEREAFLEFSNHPLPINQVHTQTELFHIIPASSEVKDSLAKIRPGNVITFNGFLTSVERTPDINWSTSVSFKEIGNEADKILYVEELTIR